MFCQLGSCNVVGGAYLSILLFHILFSSARIDFNKCLLIPQRIFLIPLVGPWKILVQCGVCRNSICLTTTTAWATFSCLSGIPNSHSGSFGGVEYSLEFPKSVEIPN